MYLMYNTFNLKANYELEVVIGSSDLKNQVLLGFT